MTQHNYCILILLTALTASLNVVAETPDPQPPLTLEEALQRVIAGNPGLLADGYNVKSAESRVAQAARRPNPRLSLDAENVAGSGSTRGTDAAEFTASIEQVLETGGKRRYRKTVAAAEHRLAIVRSKILKLNSLAATAETFTWVATIQERRLLRMELVRTAEEVVRVATARVRAGKAPAGEEARAQVALARAQIAEEAARLEWDTARTALAAQWGAESPDFIRVAGLPAPPHPQAASITNTPDFEEAVAQTGIRDAESALSQSARFPDITAGAGIRRLNDTEETTFVAGLSLPLPLFDRNQDRIRETAALAAAARQEQRAVTLRLSTALATARNRLLARQAAATQLAEIAVPKAKETLESTRRGYEQGKFSYLEVLDAQRDHATLREELLDAQADTIKAAIEMTRLSGQGL